MHVFLCTKEIVHIFILIYQHLLFVSVLQRKKIGPVPQFWDTPPPPEWTKR